MHTGSLIDVTMEISGSSELPRLFFQDGENSKSFRGMRIVAFQ